MNAGAPGSWKTFLFFHYGPKRLEEGSSVIMKVKASRAQCGVAIYRARGYTLMDSDGWVDEGRNDIEQDKNKLEVRLPLAG